MATDQKQFDMLWFMRKGIISSVSDTHLVSSLKMMLFSNWSDQSKIL